MFYEFLTKLDEMALSSDEVFQGDDYNINKKDVDLMSKNIENELDEYIKNNRKKVTSIKKTSYDHKYNYLTLNVEMKINDSTTVSKLVAAFNNLYGSNFIEIKNEIEKRIEHSYRQKDNNWESVKAEIEVVKNTVKLNFFGKVKKPKNKE